ncbi:TPA: restriction endonuclease [Bacillus cereus]
MDGHIELDVLGVDKIYIQAKRWGKTSVGIDNIQRFSGSIDTKGGNKGIFITTSTFTSDARTCSELINNKFIRLIDGQELVKFMEDLNFTFD